MYRIKNRPDMVSVLPMLAGLLQKMRVPVDQWLQHGLNGPVSGGFAEKQGIRRLIPGSHPIIEFRDWANTDNASGLWQKIYSDMVKPLRNQDFQFIFHLGDVSDKKVFAVDEVLDIIGDYASYGQVTLILDTQEADTLWQILNGGNPVPGGSNLSTARERYLFLFNTMSIDSLVVLQSGRAMYFSREGQFTLAGPSPMNISGIIHARTRFSVGYQLGVVLELASAYRVALGLATTAAYKEPPALFDSSALLEYIQNWLHIL